MTETDIMTEQPVLRKIDETVLRKAQQTLQDYKSGKANLDARIIANEEWYKLRHWEMLKQQGKVPPEDKRNRIEHKRTAWLFNSMANKHAGAMDSFPEPAVLPRSQDDEETAKQLSAIIPVILDRCDFEQTYSDNWWDKIKSGTACYAVLWDETAADGLGDIAVKAVDMLNIYWEPGIKDIQDSQNVFVIALEDNDSLVAEYPELDGKLTKGVMDVKEYLHDDSIDTTQKSAVVDWYYKVRQGKRTVLHYVKFVGDTVLFATEDDPKYVNGLYNHGMYPFVFDVLYPDKGTPAGFGYVDLFKSSQEYIDRLDTAIVLNAEEAAIRRIIAKDSMGINEDELNNPYKRIIHVSGSPNDDNTRDYVVPQLSSVYLSVLQDEINALKETSSNRDFNQGGTANGVTAASAINALQEAGNKIDRDNDKGSYRAYRKIGKLMLELIRQFYTDDRVFRITGDNGNTEYAVFNNAKMRAGTQMIAGQIFATKEPDFDIDIRAQKQSPYSKLSQNELALQFYNAGFFNPELSQQALMCIDMMDFDGKDKIRQMIQQNGSMYQQMQQMQQLLMMSAQALAEKGDPRVLQALQQQAVQTTGTAQPTGSVDMEAVNDAGNNM